MTRVAYQGEPGAFSHLAAMAVFDPVEPAPCPTFEAAFAAVEEGAAERAMIPVENSVAGRVADIHHLMPGAKLHIVAEHFQPVRHHVLGPPGMALGDVKTVHSHAMALAQCRDIIAEHGWGPRREVDTAGAARRVAEERIMGEAAIASELAAQTYGLNVLAADVQDDPNNTTRFVILANDPAAPAVDAGPCMTSFIFRVRNVPAALYKTLGGFATNGVNMTKLESYQLGGTFRATQFYADVEGHPDDPALQRALEELSFFSHEVRIVGSYPAHPYRARSRP